MRFSSEVHARQGYQAIDTQVGDATETDTVGEKLLDGLVGGNSRKSKLEKLGGEREETRGKM